MAKDYSTILNTYESIHRNPINRAIHAVGIPAIITSILGIMALIPTGVSVGDVDLSGAEIISIVTLLITLSWAWRAALAFAPILTGCYVLANSISFDSMLSSAGVWGAVFVIGWLVQFIGHAFEGHSPEFTSRPENLLLGPISVSLEILPFLRPYRIEVG